MENVALRYTLFVFSEEKKLIEELTHQRTDLTLNSRVIIHSFPLFLSLDPLLRSLI